MHHILNRYQGSNFTAVGTFELGWNQRAKEKVKKGNKS